MIWFCSVRKAVGALICWHKKKSFNSFPELLKSILQEKRERNLQTSCYAPGSSSPPFPRWVWRRRRHDCGTAARYLQEEEEKRNRLLFHILPKALLLKVILKIKQNPSKGEKKDWNVFTTQYTQIPPVGQTNGKTNSLPFYNQNTREQ